MAHPESSYSAERLLTIDEVATELALHHRTVRRLIADGEIPAVKLGTRSKSPIRVPSAELHRWLYAEPTDVDEAPSTELLPRTGALRDEVGRSSLAGPSRVNSGEGA